MLKNIAMLNSIDNQNEVAKTDVMRLIAVLDHAMKQYVKELNIPKSDGIPLIVYTRSCLVDSYARMDTIATIIKQNRTQVGNKEFDDVVFQDMLSTEQRLIAQSTAAVAEAMPRWLKDVYTRKRSTNIPLTPSAMLVVADDLYRTYHRLEVETKGKGSHQFRDAIRDSQTLLMNIRDKIIRNP